MADTKTKHATVRYVVLTGCTHTMAHHFIVLWIDIETVLIAKNLVKNKDCPMKTNKL